jgi:hypothetical protein
VTDVKVARYSKGKRPEFYADPAMDEAMSMIMVLSSELSVLRDRLDTVESLAEEKGVFLHEEVESYEPGPEALHARELARQDFLERLFFVANKRATELASKDTGERYDSVLTNIAEG